MVKRGELGTGLVAEEVGRRCPHVMSPVLAPWSGLARSPVQSVLPASERVSLWAKVALPAAGTVGLPTAVWLLPDTCVSFLQEDAPKGESILR